LSACILAELADRSGDAQRVLAARLAEPKLVHGGDDVLDVLPILVELRRRVELPHDRVGEIERHGFLLPGRAVAHVPAFVALRLELAPHAGGEIEAERALLGEVEHVELMAVEIERPAASARVDGRAGGVGHQQGHLGHSCGRLSHDARQQVEFRHGADGRRLVERHQQCHLLDARGG
jgi:hypothetical protein